MNVGARAGLPGLLDLVAKVLMRGTARSCQLSGWACEACVTIKLGEVRFGRLGGHSAKHQEDYGGGRGICGGIFGRVLFSGDDLDAPLRAAGERYGTGLLFGDCTFRERGYCGGVGRGETRDRDVDSSFTGFPPPSGARVD